MQKLTLTRITVSNLLSFGPEGLSIDVAPLNVLIGPNASGKSNLIDVLGFLHGLPTDATVPIREGGGIREWLWKGAGEKVARAGVVEVQFSQMDGPELVHRLGIAAEGVRLQIALERVEDGQRVVWDKRREGLTFMDQSIAVVQHDLQARPELSALRRFYQGMSVHREWLLGRGSEVRRPQPADAPDHFLQPDL